MGQYEARLERDLSRIRESLADLAEAVQTAVENASLALFSGDHELSYNVCLADHPINRASRALDRSCLGFIAVHLPTAGHLRFVSAVMHTNIELERIGDYAKTISRESVQLRQPPSGLIRGQLEELSQEVRRILECAVGAFTHGDVDAARAGIRAATEAGHRTGTSFSSLMNDSSASVGDLLAHVVILNSFDRVIDQAKNICEETIFAVTGETKAPKSYHVLFLDQDNSLLGPMAQAIASRNHPLSGQYDTGGQRCAGAFADGLGPFLAERGIELKGKPQIFDRTADLRDYHVIVSLQGPVRDFVDQMPFSTIALEWDLNAAPSPESAPGSIASLESLYRILAPQIRDLMVTLHGEEKS